MHYLKFTSCIQLKNQKNKDAERILCKEKSSREEQGEILIKCLNWTLPGNAEYICDVL